LLSERILSPAAARDDFFSDEATALIAEFKAMRSPPRGRGGEQNGSGYIEPSSHFSLRFGHGWFLLT